MTREQFSQFIDALRKDLQDNKDEWENPSLASFLEAMSSWVADMDGFYMNHDKIPPESVSWAVFANILYAAKVYE